MAKMASVDIRGALEEKFSDDEGLVDVPGEIGGSDIEVQSTQEMVLQATAWRQKISSKIMAVSRYTPDMFVKSQWQRSPGISMCYLVYRWVHASAFFSIMLASVVDLGRPKGDYIHYAKWLIYLTHWGFTICTLQALLAAYLVTRAHYKYQEEEVEAMKMNCCLRIYRGLHNIAVVEAFGITAIYWNFVYSPGHTKLDAVNILVHAGNSVLMLIDLIVVAHPIRIIDFYWPLTFSFSYAVFNYLYFLGGGTDRRGRPFVYKILDWEKFGRTLIVVQGCLFFSLILHVIVSLFCLLRCKVAQVLRRREAERREDQGRNKQGATNEIPINDFV